MARIQFELFIEQIVELKSEMTKELSLFLQGMLEETSQMMPNAQEMFDELKASMIEDFLRDSRLMASMPWQIVWYH